MSPRSKPGGVLWRWFDAVERAAFADEDLTTARRQAIILVGHLRARHADPNGGNCCPSQLTLAVRSGLTRDTVRVVDGWLVKAGLMRLVKNYGRGASTRYRLVLPLWIDDRDDSHSSEAIDDRDHGHSGDGLGDRQGDRQGDRDDGHNLRPPSTTEEEEGAGAPLRGAAPQPPEALAALRREPLAAEVVAIVGMIGDHAGMSLDPTLLGPAVAGAKARTGWGDEAIAVYCVEKLKHLGGNARIPDALLATDLATRLSGDTVPSPRVRLAEALRGLRDLEASVNPDEQLGYRSPRSLAKGALMDAELVGSFDWAEGVGDDLWDVKPADLEEYTRIVNDAVEEARRRHPDPRHTGA